VRSSNGCACSTWRGMRDATAFTYPKGSFSRAAMMAAGPCSSKSSAKALMKRACKRLRAALGLPPGFPDSPGL